MYFPTETVIPNVTSWDYQTLSRPLNFLCLEIWPLKIRGDGKNQIL